MPKIQTPVEHWSQLVVDTLLSELDGAKAVLAATVDGFEIASAGCAHAGVEPARLAAMVSSMSAISEAATRDCGMGAPHALHVDASEGRVVVRCIRVVDEAVIVAVLTDRTALLGMVLNRLAAAEGLIRGALGEGANLARQGASSQAGP